MEVGPAWNTLWRRGDRSVFQSHGWVAAWWTSKRIEDQSRLCVGLCWDGDNLAAVMPCATRRHRGVRVLEWAAKDCTDYCDALVDTKSAESGRALEHVWAAVACTGGIDLAYLSHVRPDAALHGLLDRKPQALTLKLGRRSARSRQVRHQGPDAQTWFQGLDEAVRTSHLRGMQAIAEMGPVRSEICGPSDAIDGLIEQMIALKQRWLADAGQSYPILDDNAATLGALVEELKRQQAIRIFVLRCGDQLVAALLSIATGTRMQVFFAAHDPRFDHVDPETLAVVEFAIRAIGSGTVEVDLLCVEGDGSFAFADSQVDLASYVGAKTLIGKLALAVGERG